MKFLIGENVLWQKKQLFFPLACEKKILGYTGGSFGITKSLHHFST